MVKYGKNNAVLKNNESFFFRETTEVKKPDEWINMCIYEAKEDETHRHARSQNKTPFAMMLSCVTPKPNVNKPLRTQKQNQNP